LDRSFCAGKDTEGTNRPTRQLVHFGTAGPEVKAKLAAQGLYPVGTCGVDFSAFIRKQYEDYGRFIREANIKAE